MSEEMLDAYDINYNKTGKTIPRKGRNIEPGEYILKAALIAINSDNKYMIQIVADGNNDYAIPIGTVKSGEESLDTLIRELNEEQGLVIKSEDLNFFKRKIVTNNVIWDIYYIERDFRKDDMVLQEEEVTDVLFLSFDELTSIYNKHCILRRTTYEAICDFEEFKAKQELLNK